MQLIKQRLQADCGIAAAAMIAKCTYEQALKHDPNPEAERGVSTNEMTAMLKGITKAEWSISYSHSGLPLVSFKYMGTCLLVIRKDGVSYGHWVMLHEGRVYDPDLLLFPEPVAIADYKRNGWRVIRIIHKLK